MEVVRDQKVTTLKSNAVGLPEAVAQSAALIGPAAGATVGNVFIAGLSGFASPFSFVAGTVVCIAVAKVIGDYARKLPSAGSFYTYLTRTFGPKTGFVTGVLLFGAYLLLLPFQFAFFGSFVQSVLSPHVNIPWQIIGLMPIVLSTALTVIGVKLSVRVGLVGLAFELGVFIILAVLIVIQGGATGNSLQPFNPAEGPQFSGVLLAVVFTIFAFVGFESSTTLGEEVREPTRTIPRAVLLTTVLIGIFYILMSYSEVIGFGISKDGLQKLQTDPNPFTDLATTYGNGLLSVLVTLGTISSFVVLNVVTVVAGSRMIFAMGRDHMLPGILGTVSRRKTPAAAAYAVAAWAIFWGLGFGTIYGPITFSSWFGFLATLFFIGAYAMLAVGVMKFYWQRFRAEFNWFGNGVVPVIALLGIAWVTYGNVYPVPAAPFNYFIYVTIAVIVIAAAVAFLLERRDPQRMREAGQLFAAVKAEEMQALGPGTRET